MKISTLVLLCVAIPVAGCSAGAKRDTNPTQAVSSSASSIAPVELIAQDFVNALRQLRSVPAEGTTVALQRTNRDDSFTRAMLFALQDAGYATRWVDDEGSASLFQYRQAGERDQNNIQNDTYELAVGVVEMRRTYARSGQQVQPTTPLYVRGTDATGLVLNDDIFNPDNTVNIGSGAGTPRRVDETTEQDLQAVQLNAIPLEPLAQIQGNSSPRLGLQNSSTLQVPADANPLNPIISQAASGRSLDSPLISLQQEENVFALGGSNFEDVLAGHQVVVEKVLTFANDSMRLGSFNKQLVEQLVADFNPQTDVFSVLGCSMGPTQVEGGNAALALGRAGRVVEALRFAGVNDQSILDEGCWAGDGTLENLPRRGVVLTLNREV